MMVQTINQAINQTINRGLLPMKLAGLALLLCGWILVVAAVAILSIPAERTAFVVAGLLVEMPGLFLLGRAHRAAGERS
jgi:hypothetical protein